MRNGECWRVPYLLRLSADSVTHRSVDRKLSDYSELCCDRGNTRVCDVQHRVTSVLLASDSRAGSVTVWGEFGCWGAGFVGQPLSVIGGRPLRAPGCAWRSRTPCGVVGGRWSVVGNCDRDSGWGGVNRPPKTAHRQPLTPLSCVAPTSGVRSDAQPTTVNRPRRHAETTNPPGRRCEPSLVVGGGVVGYRWSAATGSRLRVEIPNTVWGCRWAVVGRR